MIEDLKRIKKVDDIINSEGTILGLYKIDDNLLLGSLLIDKSGELFYSTDLINLKKYIDSKITLRELYEKSEDFIVTKRFRANQENYLKSDLINSIKFIDNYFNEISPSMRNENLKFD